jgi:flavodoxin
MKTAVLYYSYTGNTEQLAREAAKKGKADLIEIKDEHRPGKLKAFTVGCFSAMRGKAWGIQPVKRNLSTYDKLVIFSPVWASNPTPAIYALLNILPSSKDVEVKMVSASGKSGCKEKITAIVEGKGSRLKGFEDLKG